MTNAEIAVRFEQVADLLEFQGANPFRIRAYRNGARAIHDLAEPVDGEVVGDVVPAPDVHVVALDAAESPGHVVGGVAARDRGAGRLVAFLFRFAELHVRTEAPDPQRNRLAGVGVADAQVYAWQREAHGSGAALADTLAANEGIEVAIIPPWYDVDEPEDRFEHHIEDTLKAGGDLCDPDDDGDGVDDGLDCAPLDASASAPPDTVAGVAVDGAGPTTLSWTADAQAALYDVAGGDVSDLAVSNTSGAVCLGDDVAATSWEDSRADPAAGAAYYYLVRAANVCGDGGWGTDSVGADRTPTGACP